MSRSSSWLICGLVPSILLATGIMACGDTVPGNPCVTHDFVEPVVQNAIEKVDLLFVIDNSSTMAEEQAALGLELPRMVRVLTSGDRTGDGPSADDFPRVSSLQVAVVTSDMGVANFAVPTCTVNPQFGDDGLLRTTGNTAVTGCMSGYPMVLQYDTAAATLTPEQFGADLRCTVIAGAGDCSFKQPLEAALKAVIPSTASTTFYGGTHGHGDVENAGFLRTDSVLAIVVVTDRDDSSIGAGYEGIFDQSAGSAYTGDLNLRCFNYPETQSQVQRYIDGFKGLRAGRENLLVFGAITGVPPDLVGTGTQDYDAILADPRMVKAIDTSSVSGRLVPSCSEPGLGYAVPPRRIVEVARGFGESGVVQSICQASFTGAVDAIIAKIGRALGSPCLSTVLTPTESNLVRCDVIVTIPPPSTFAGQPGACSELVGVEPTPRHRNPNGSIECKAIQLSRAGATTPSSAEGWYYDDFSPETLVTCGARGGRIAFTPGARLADGLSARLECSSPVPVPIPPPGSTGIQVGTPCTVAADICSGATGTRLACEPASRTCQIPCATGVDCPSMLTCAWSFGTGFCVNPACR